MIVQIMNKNTLISKIKSYKPVLMLETPQSAAVLVILLEDVQDQLKMVLTKRSLQLPTYAGDYSFPGGMKDDTDSGLKATAIREVKEELNLAEPHYEIIGQLDDFNDRYGHLVRSFVARMTEEDFKKYYKISSTEIADIYYFDLRELAHIKEDTRLESMTRRKPSHIYTHDNVTIWGLTAGIMVHFSNIIYDLKQPLGKNIL